MPTVFVLYKDKAASCEIALEKYGSTLEQAVADVLRKLVGRQPGKFELILPDEFGSEELRRYGTPKTFEGKERLVLDPLVLLREDFFEACGTAAARKAFILVNDIPESAPQEAVPACVGGSADAILAYIMQAEERHLLPLRPHNERMERACCDHPLVPPAELDLLPNVQSREDALGLSFGVFNNRLHRSLSCADSTRQDTQLAVYGTPGTGKTRFLEEIARATPLLVASSVAHAREHLPKRLQEMVAGWVAVAVTYNGNTKFNPTADADPVRGLALRMLVAHFFAQADAVDNPLGVAVRAFPHVSSVVEAASAIIRDHWRSDTVYHKAGSMALLLAVDELVLADGPAGRTSTHANALQVVHQVGRLQEAFMRQPSSDGRERKAIVFSVISTLDKVAFGPTAPESGRQIVYAPLRSLPRPAAAANSIVQALVRTRPEYQVLFFDCGRLPRGALYCAEIVLGYGEHGAPINTLEHQLFLRTPRNPYLAEERPFLVLATHALCSHALPLDKPVPGLGDGTTLADLVAQVAYDGVEVASSAPGQAVLDTYVPYFTPLRLLLYACYEPKEKVPQREVQTAATTVAYIAQQRAIAASQYLNRELIIGLRGGKTEERFTDGHEFERLLVMRLSLCPSLRLELRLAAEGMRADESLSSLLGGAEALCNERTREWLEGITILCVRRRVVVSVHMHVRTYLRGLYKLGDSGRGGRSVSEVLEDVVLYPEPASNVPGVDFALFLKAKGKDEKPLRLGIGVEACSSQVRTTKPQTGLAVSATVRPELSLEQDVLEKHILALWQMGLGPRPKRATSSRPDVGAMEPPLKTSRSPEGKACATSCNIEVNKVAETELKEEEEETETQREPESMVEEDVEGVSEPVLAASKEFVPEQWAINTDNGFDRFLFIVMSNRASSRIDASHLPDDVVVVSHTALRKVDMVCMMHMKCICA
eukprot:m51a1_g13764 hypothetical protein (939) ;mRNA; f:246844-250521